MKLKELTLLYVEDDQEIRSRIENILKEELKEVYVANDGAEGLELYKEKAPDIVLTDIVMPNMDGIEMSKAIKDIDYYQPIIVLTAYNDNETLQKTLNIGIDKYITKPIEDVDSLLESIEMLGKLLKDKMDPFKVISESNNPMLLTTGNEEDNKIVFVNNAFEKLYGYDEDVVIGLNPRFLHQDDVTQSSLELVREALKNNEAVTVVVRNYTRDNILKYIELSISPIFDEKTNKLKYFLGIHKDITREQKILNDLKSMF